MSDHAPPCPPVLIVAHRGYSALAPENTLAAFRAALEIGAPAMECDVHLSADGHVVVIHDDSLDRTTDGTGHIAVLSLADIQQADAGAWKGEQYRGERVPTLAQVLSLIQGRARLIVEIKAEGIVPQVVQVVRDAGALREVTIVSFSLDTLHELRTLEPRLPAGFLTGGIVADAEQLADELITRALSAHVQFLSVAHNGITPALLRRAALCGMSVWAWTVNDPDRVRDLARQGVASITSDDPAMAMAATGRR